MANSQNPLITAHIQPAPAPKTPNQIAAGNVSKNYNAPIYGGAASSPSASMNPAGKVQAPAAVSSSQATKVATGAQKNINDKMAGAASITAAKQNLITTYDAQGNMMKTGGVMDNGNQYQELYSPGMPGYVPDPKQVQAIQDKIAKLQQQQKQQQADDALKNAASGNPQNPTPDNPTYSKPSSVTPPDGFDYTNQYGQAQWYNQDPASFETWAKDQGLSSDNLFQVKIQAGSLKLQDLQNQGNNYLNQYLSGTFPLTPSQQAQVAGLKQMWDGTIAAQQSANQTYLGASAMASARQGGQYDPMGSVAQANRAIQTGLDRISQFQGAEQEAINNMIQGFQDADYKAVTEALDRSEKLTKDITDNLKTVNDSIVKAREDAQAQQNHVEEMQYNQVTKPIQDIGVEAAKNGAPDKIQQAIKNAKTVEEAIAASGSYLQSGTGTLGDYIQYKRSAEAKGLTPMDYMAFKDSEDKKASQLKVSEAYAKAYAEAKGKNKADAEAQAEALKAAGLNGHNDVTNALNIIVGSLQNPTKEQIKTITNALINGEDPLTVAKNQAQNIMGSNEATSVLKFETAKNSLTSLQQRIKDFYAKGGQTNIFKGNYEKVINNLGEVNNPELVDLSTQIAAQLQIYRNAISGTAYSEQEGKDISSIFPGINKSEGLNNAILNARMKAFDDVIDGGYRAVLGSAYDKLKAAQPITQEQAKSNIANYYASADETSRQNLMKMFSVPGATDADVYNNLKQRGLIQ